MYTRTHIHMCATNVHAHRNVHRHSLHMDTNYTHWPEHSAILDMCKKAFLFIITKPTPTFYLILRQKWNRVTYTCSLFYNKQIKVAHSKHVIWMPTGNEKIWIDNEISQIVHKESQIYRWKNEVWIKSIDHRDDDCRSPRKSNTHHENKIHNDQGSGQHQSQE
jgi:hypothetical protein